MDELESSLVEDPKVAFLLADHWVRGREYSAYRPRGSRTWLLIYTLAGGGMASTPKGEVQCSPGSLTILPPRVEHRYGTEPMTNDWEFCWAHFQPRSHWRELLAWPGAGGSILQVSIANKTVEALCLEMVSRANGNAFDQQLAMLRLEEILIVAHQAAPNGGNQARDTRIERVIAFMQTEYARPLDMGDLAAIAGLSPSRFSHLFTEQIGISPREFLEQERLRRAQQQLSMGGLTLREIAQRVGFANEFYFSRRFKEHIGMSPSEFRNRG